MSPLPLFGCATALETIFVILMPAYSKVQWLDSHHPVSDRLGEGAGLYLPCGLQALGQTRWKRKGWPIKRQRLSYGADGQDLNGQYHNRVGDP